MPLARNGEVELYYEAYGDGPPLLLIQGLAYTHQGWLNQIPELSLHFRLIAFDNRGIGRSSIVTDTYTVHDLADDAVAVLADAGVDAAHVAGISLGGLAAQSLAARHPERVRRLVLISTTHGGPEAVPIPADVVAILTDPGEGLTPEQLLRRNMQPAFRPGWPEEHPETVDELVAMRLSWAQPMEAYVAQATAGATADTTEVLSKIQAPTLVVHGTADRVVPVENAELLAEKIDGARMALREGAGHMLLVEEAGWLNATIREFCEEGGR